MTGARWFFVRLLPNIRYGIESYPDEVARRLRALNITAWIAAAVTALFGILRFLDPVAGRWRFGVVNLVAAAAYASLPLLHRIGPRAATLGFTAIAYPLFFFSVAVSGTDSGADLYFLTGMVLPILFLGSEQLLLSMALAVIGVAGIVAARLIVPQDTGFLLPSEQLFTFILNIATISVIFFAIIFYALRQTARAEAVAQREYDRSEALLANILPASVAARLKDEKPVLIADRYDDASILFADMAGFTERASTMAPDHLVEFLNRVFTEFDRLVELRGLEKIKTTGDSYMVVSGVPSPRPDHAQALARLALDLRAAAMELRDAHGRGIPIRIGIGSGPVVAGIVGRRKFFYDVWGDAVNVASRMESTGMPGQIQISQNTFEHLREEFVLEDRGPVQVKGKGTVRTWFLVAARETEASIRQFAN